MEVVNVESLQHYVSELYVYIVMVINTLMNQWYLAVLSGLAIIVVAKYLESVLIATLTAITGIFIVVPVILQAFQSGNMIVGVASIIILALLYFIMKYIYKLALFVVGLGMGYIFTNALLGFIQVPPNVQMEIKTGFGTLNWVSLAVGIFVGFVTVKFTKQLTAMLGIFGGSYLSSLGILIAYTGDKNIWKKAFPNPYGLLSVSNDTLMVFLVSLFLLMVFGVYFNFRKKKRGE